MIFMNFNVGQIIKVSSPIDLNLDMPSQNGKICTLEVGDTAIIFEVRNGGYYLELGLQSANGTGWIIMAGSLPTAIYLTGANIDPALATKNGREAYDRILTGLKIYKMSKDSSNGDFAGLTLNDTLKSMELLQADQDFLDTLDTTLLSPRGRVFKTS